MRGDREKGDMATFVSRFQCFRVSVFKSCMNICVYLIFLRYLCPKKLRGDMERGDMATYAPGLLPISLN